MHAVMETYKRLGISPTSGRGSWLFDEEGNRYLDFIGGIATNSLGHGHPALVGACGDGWGERSRIEQAWLSGHLLGEALVERLGGA